MGGEGARWPTGSSGILWTVIVPLVIVLVAIYKFFMHPAFISPLSQIPNAHWSSSFSPAWILWTRFKFHENRDVHEAHRKHGTVVRLGPNEISVNTVDGGIRNIYAGGFEKGDWYSIFDNYGVPCMFSSWHSRPHSIRKRMISHIYSKSTMHTSPVLASQAATILYSRLLPILTTYTQGSLAPKGVDVHDLWNATTMDFITAYQFGLSHSSNFLENVGFRQHWLELYQSRKTYTFFPQELPRLTKIMHSIGVRLVPRWVDYANQEIEAWCAGLCKSATTAFNSTSDQTVKPEDEPVVLSALLSGIEKEKQSKGADSILKDTALKEPELSVSSEMLDQLAAGHETSGITLTYLTWHLSKNLSIQKALRAELLTLDSPIHYPPKLTSPAATQAFEGSQKDWLTDIHMPSSKHLDSLPLLHAVIMETLRLQAPIPGGQPRVSPYPSCTLGNFEIPGGVRVQSNAWSLHRNPTVYPNPDTWDHTRWLDDRHPSAEDRRERDRWFWAFSSGGRMCIGSNFAIHEIKLVIAAIYTNFETHIVDDNGIEQMDGYTCGPKSNCLYLRFEKVPRGEMK